jgi:hypothetical protein
MVGVGERRGYGGPAALVQQSPRYSVYKASRTPN